MVAMAVEVTAVAMEVVEVAMEAAAGLLAALAQLGARGARWVAVAWRAVARKVALAAMVAVTGHARSLCEAWAT